MIRLYKLLILLLIIVKIASPVETEIDTLEILPGDSVIVLRNRWIVPSSISIKYLSKFRLELDSLKVDELNGKVYGFEPACDTVDLAISYQFFDLALESQKIVNPPPRLYTQKEIKNSEPSGSIKTETPVPSSYDFIKSGTLYRGITIGSGSGMSLKSGLNLELQGNLSDDIKIIGSLTDQNIPIQPEGNTQTLDEIDKVFIKVAMPHENITLGDYELFLEGGELGKYERKLQGLYIESGRRIGKTFAGGAVTKGQYHSNFFMGEEENQGPYQLYGKEGETAIIVLAGTEKVWINGEALTRGENYDYVIDYSTGEITFTPRRLITSDSRITVDFQYSNLVYAKNIWMAGNSNSFANDKVKLSAKVINESDDRENPIELEITDEDIEKLQQVGDNGEIAFQSSIREDSSGSYILKDSILIFVGKNEGTHSAAFYNVGAKGEYRKVHTAEYAYFEWIDKTDPDISESKKKEALYLPVKPLKLPANQRLYHIQGSWQPSKRFSISSEVAASDFDKNTFSPLDDADNKGNAVNLEAKLSLPKLTIGDISLTGRFKSEGENFNPIDRNKTVEYRRKWDLPSDSTQGERFFEGGVQYKLYENLRFSAEAGTFEQGVIQSDRYKVDGLISYKRLEQANFYVENISSTKDLNPRNWKREGFYTRLNIFNVKPYFGIDYEKRKGDDIEQNNFQFVDQTYGIMSKPEGKFRWKVEGNLRTDNDFANGEWQKNAKSENITFSGQILNWNTISSQWDYTRRKKKYFSSDDLSPDINFHLFYLMLKQNPKKLPFHWETNMRIEEERTVKKEWRYFYVGKGEGSFIYDSTFADYVPHPQGDYVLRVLPSNVKEPVTSIQNGFRFQFNGNSIKDRANLNWLKQISTLTDIRLQQQIKKNDASIKLWTYLPEKVDENWAYFNRMVQQDISYRLNSLNGYLRFRYVNSNRVSQLDVRGQEENGADEYSLFYKGEFVFKTKLNSRLAVNKLKRLSDFNSLRDRNIISTKFENEISYLIDKRNYLDFEVILNWDEQQIDNPVESFLLGLKGGYERKVTDRGRWEVFAEVDNVNVKPRNEPIPWEMSKGKKEGMTIGWGTSIEYRVGKFISVRVNYEGWNEPNRDIYHLGSGEVRAFF